MSRVKQQGKVYEKMAECNIEVDKDENGSDEYNEAPSTLG